MSMEPWEAEQEEQYLRLYEEHREQALEDFRSERLRAYLLSVPDVPQNSIHFLDEANRVRSHSAEAALVLAAAASEVAIKSLLLRPLISGLVGTEAVASLFADELLKPTGFVRAKKLLFDLLNRVARIDLATYSRNGSTILLWNELESSASRRNDVVHRCEVVGLVEAEQALNVAAELLLVVFPHVVAALGLHLHNRVRVCGDYHLPVEVESLLSGA